MGQSIVQTWVLSLFFAYFPCMNNSGLLTSDLWMQCLPSCTRLFLFKTDPGFTSGMRTGRWEPGRGAWFAEEKLRSSQGRWGRGAGRAGGGGGAYTAGGGAGMQGGGWGAGTAGEGGDAGMAGEGVACTAGGGAGMAGGGGVQVGQVGEGVQAWQVREKNGV